MTLRDNLAPDKGVTVLEPTNQDVGLGNTMKGSTMQRRTSLMEAQVNYQVFKKGKPFTKMATNEQSPRMTRENYFKIADSQALGTMREEMIQIMRSGNSQDEIGGQTSMRRSGLENDRKQQSPTNSVLISIKNGLDKKSDASSEAGAQATAMAQKTSGFKRRNQSIDQVIKAKGAKKLIMEESVYSFRKSMLKKGSVQINPEKLIPIEQLTERMKLSNAKLRSGSNNPAALHSQTPSHAVLNLNDSNFIGNDKRLAGNMTMTENMFSASKNSTARNAQWQFGSSGKIAPILPALNSTRSVHGQ